MSYSFPTTYIDKGATKRLPCPSRPLSEGIKVNTLCFDADSGHEQRRKKGDPRKTFEFVFVALTHAQAQCIEDFFLEVLNVYAFDWTHPFTDDVIKVKFDMDTFCKEMFGHSKHHGPLYKIAIKLEQVY